MWPGRGKRAYWKGGRKQAGVSWGLERAMGRERDKNKEG